MIAPSWLTEHGLVPCNCGSTYKRTSGPWSHGPGCERKGRGGVDSMKHTPAGGTGNGTRSIHPAPSPRKGKAAEDAMAALLAGPYIVEPFKVWLLNPRPGVWVREFPWGLALDPVRRFRADFAYAGGSILLEIEGGAHGVQRQRRHDVRRDQLAQQAGLRIVRVLPEQVADGSALALVRAVMEGK